jgi:mono/diheme cytochrome c family protein
MEAVGFLVPWILIGVAVIFVAYSGGPGRAREAYLTRGGRAFRVVIPLLYLGVGIAVPAAVIAGRGEATGGTDRLEQRELTAQEERGKERFQQACASCHNLDAVNARGVTGPDLDEIGAVTRDRIANAIRIGGTGQGRMPAGLLEGEEARAVAAYVARVAGK